MYLVSVDRKMLLRTLSVLNLILSKDDVTDKDTVREHQSITYICIASDKKNSKQRSKYLL